ncbi:hypothetical protein HZB93_03690 [Candidatus Falkowbacteria bacterium]|nr:hypothetical protein [Candidatus Falkowbacteria bacterium]
MTEPSMQGTAGTRPETPTAEALIETAFKILHELLRIYGFEADDEDEDGPEKDYRINVNRDDDAILALDINANQPLRGILIGHRSSNVAAMEKILINSLFQRLHLGSGQRLGRAILLSVNGTRLDTRRENGDEERPPSRGERSSAGVVTVIVSPGVEVRTRVAR